MRTEESVKLAEFHGKRNALLQMTSSATFLGLDNRLMMSRDLKTWKNVLETENTENMFWHISEAKDGTLFVQEYGSPLTGIYRSTDEGETWKQIVNSKEIDKTARHFHSIAYDQYRDLLIVTLGDGNLVKIAISDDYGDTWKPLYTWAYQCLPIVILEDYIVFGMDSGISRGIIIWNPSENKWQSIHLKNVSKLSVIDSMQSSDLKLLSNDIWIMSTGGGSLLSSGDLRNWRMLHLGEKERFESHMISNEKNGIVAAAMGDVVMIIDSKALNTTYQHADVKQYHALFPRMKGLGYVVKRRIQYSLGKTRS
jgi:photosystem II stability/assembly factor-like uncharacterized protein